MLEGEYNSQNLYVSRTTLFGGNLIRRHIIIHVQNLKLVVDHVDGAQGKNHNA